MNPHVRAKVRKRNLLRKEISTKREEWRTACKEANEAILEAKKQSWNELLSSALPDQDPTKVWQIVKSLNGTPCANSPNEALVHNSKTLTDPKAKANAFAQHYANVSSLKMSKEDKGLNLRCKKMVEGPSVDDMSCAVITLQELIKAIFQMKGKGAAGPDEIPPIFLKSLGPIALNELLEIYNLSFLHGDCPNIWRVATIIPLLKAGKPASEIASFRPVSLTSCIAKLMERILANRIYYQAEHSNMFSKLQAGFRKGRSCEDNITRLVQKIMDVLTKSLV